MATLYSVSHNGSKNKSEQWKRSTYYLESNAIKKMFLQNCHTIRTKELICMQVCVFSDYNTVLLQFYAQFYSNSIQIYHCKNHGQIRNKLVANVD